MYHLRTKPRNAINMTHQSHTGRFGSTTFHTSVQVIVIVLVCLLCYAWLSSVEAAKGQGAGSLVDWKSILDNAGRNPDEDLDTHLILAVAYANLGKIPEATREFRVIEASGYDDFGEKVIRENKERVKSTPDDIVSLNLLAFAYYAFGDYPKSADCFESLMKLDPMNVWVHHYYAYSLSRVDRMDEAIDVLKAALTIDPSNEYTHLLLGLAYREKGWYLLAILELARAGKAVSELSRLIE